VHGIVAPKVHTVRNGCHPPVIDKTGFLKRHVLCLCVRILLPIPVTKRILCKKGVVDLAYAANVCLQTM